MTEINLVKMFKLLWRKIWIILISTAGAAIIMFIIVSLATTPTYQSSIWLYVSSQSSVNDSSNISSGDLTTAENLAETCIVLIRGNVTLKQVIEEAGLDYTTGELKSMVKSATVSDTGIISVTVTSESAQEAFVIANAMAETVPAVIEDILIGSTARVLQTAELAEKPSSSDISSYTAGGAAIGFFGSIIVILILSLILNGMTAEEKIRRDFADKPVLAVIPDMDDKKKKKEFDLICGKMSFAAAEAHKLLRTNLSFCFTDDKDCRVIGVTSSNKGEGKSTTAVNIAYTLAQSGIRVCLMDCDLRLPVEDKILHVSRKPGIVNLLAGQAGVKDCMRRYSDSGTSFYVIPAGDIPPNPSELLSSDRMKKIIEALTESFDFIVLDLPPMDVVSDALAASGLMDGLVFVVREDYYDRRVFGRSMHMLDEAQIKLLGVTVTFSKTLKKEYKRKKYGYGYGYENSRAEVTKGAGKIKNAAARAEKKKQIHD